MTNICRFHIPALGTLQDIYQEFNSILMVKLAQKLPAEQLAELLQGYKLHCGKGGEVIFASEFSAYDYFNGGDSVLDLELDGDEKVQAEDGTLTENPFFSKELWSAL